MTTISIIGIVAVVAAIAAYLGSVSRRPQLDPIDASTESRWLVRVLASRPRLAHFVKRRLDPTSAAGLLLTVGLALVFLLALAAGWVFESLDRGSGFARFDQSIAEFGSENATGTSTFVLNRITDLGGTLVVTLITLAVSAYGWFRYRSWNVAIFMVSVTAGQALVNNALKWMVGRDRPDIDQLASFAGSSFPSGHSAAAAATWAAVALVLGINAGRLTRGLLAGGAALIAFSVAATRALLGVHWLTDVIAGVAVGWAWFIVVAVAFGGRRMQIGAPFRRATSDGPATADVGHRLDVPPMGLTDVGRIAGWFAVIYGVGVAVGFTLKAFSSDEAINVWFEERRTGVLNTLTDAGSAFSDTSTVVIALTLAAIVLVIVTRRWHEASFLVGAVALETSGFLAIAYTVGRDRPAVAQLDVSPPTASFPSGHTAAAVALYVGLALLMRWHAEKRWTKAVAYSAAVVIPSIVALSRIYRGMHFTTDVVAGLVLGLASVWVLAIVYERRRPAEAPSADSAPTNQQTNGHRPTRTPTRRIAVVANPVGAEQPSRQLKQLMHDRNIDADWFETTEDDPGIGQTRRAVDGGVDVVVACGGDGTVRACIESVAETDAALAVLPAGTGNLLATNLSIPDTAAELLDSILDGDTTRIDIGRANGESFAVMAGIGLDARVMRDTARSAKDRFGVMAYVAEGIRHVSDQPVKCTVTVDGQPVYQGDAATVLVGNLGEIQTGLSLFPDGSATDGRLDVLIIEADDAGSWARTGWEILTRSSTSGSPTHRFSGVEIRVDLEEPTPYELDGEPRPPVTRIEFHCTPAALEVAVPRETP